LHGAGNMQFVAEQRRIRGLHPALGRTSDVADPFFPPPTIPRERRPTHD
jgi:hypothetical protein